MSLYRLTLRLKSPLGTPLIGPTLFGQLCWVRREVEGDSDLNAFLNDEDRIWRLSDGFPADYLPKPLVCPQPVPKDKFRDLKRIKKRIFVTRKVFLKNRNAWDETVLNVDTDTAGDQTLKKRIAHNHVDRGGHGTQEDGGLYFLDEDWRFSDPARDKVDLYIETSEPLGQVRGLLKQLGEQGYGRDASTGRGRWEIVSAREDSDLSNGLGNRRVSLSRGTLDERMRDTLWRIEPHFGRLGPELSLTGVSAFKRPVLLTRPGATFRSEDDGPFGHLLRNVHPTRPEVLLNALHLVVTFSEASNP